MHRLAVQTWTLYCTWYFHLLSTDCPRAPYIQSLGVTPEGVTRSVLGGPDVPRLVRCARLRPHHEGSVCYRDQEDVQTVWSSSPTGLVTSYSSLTYVAHIFSHHAPVPTRRRTPVQPLHYSTVRPELCLLGVTS